MKLALAVILAAIGCKRPVEPGAPPLVSSDAGVDSTRDAPPIDVAAPAAVTTTVIQTQTAGDTFLVLAAGKDQGVDKSWTVTFVADGPPVTCVIIRVDQHETHCKLQGARLPSAVVRIEPQPAD